MKKSIIKNLGLNLGIFAGCLMPLKAQTIYTVDMAKVYDNFYKTKPAQDNFRLLAEQAQKEFEKMMQEGKTLFDERQNLLTKLNNPALQEETKKDLEKQIQALDEKINAKGEEINLFRQKKDESLDQQRQAILSEHFKEINVGVEAIAKVKKADIVLNKAGGGVLFSKDELDLTQAVIDQVNKPAKNNTADKNKTSSNISEKK